MSHPLQHAEHSVAQFGGTVAAYLPTHHWFDATKAAYANFRHRAVRHHAFGVAAALQAGHRRDVCEQHLYDDCGRVPTIADWLTDLPIGRFRARPFVPALAQAERSGLVYSADPTLFLPLHEWMDAPTAEWMHPAARAVTHHAFGAFWAEEVFGPAIVLPDGRKIPTRVVVEQHCRTELNGMPSVQDWLHDLPAHSWMFAEVRKPGQAPE